jgi:hypothetical protein
MAFDGRFEQDGQVYYVSGKVSVQNPGGDYAKDGFRNVFNSFFSNPVTQSFLESSGIAKYIETPAIFKKNIRAGKNSGRAVGFDTGYKWIANAAGGVL